MFSENKHPTLCFHRWTRKGFAVFASLHKVIKIGVVTFACTLTQLSYQPLIAEEQDSTSNPDRITLNEVVVSDNQPVAWSGKARYVQLSEQREINASPAKSLDGILESIAGLDIRQRGSDVQADISIRGGTFDQVLILLNGVNLTDPQSGHFTLDLPVDLQTIKRIELLQGPGSRIWGPNAYSGVINIVTEPAPFDRRIHSEIHLEDGNFGYFGGGISLDFNGANWKSRLSASAKHSDGYRRNTDYDLFNSHFQTSWSSEKYGNLQFQAGFLQKAFGANSFYSFAYPNQYEQTKTFFSSLNWEKKLGSTTLQAQVSERLHHDRFELFRNSENAANWYTGHNYHLTSVSSGNLHLLQRNRFGKTIVGIDIRNEHILSNVLGLPLASIRKDFFDETGLFTKQKNRTNTRLFADQTVYWNEWTIAGGISGNLHSDFGPYLYGGMDAEYRLSESITLSGNLNHSFRLPTFTDLYYKSATQMSDPDLKPEQSTTYDVGFRYRKNHLKFSGTAFYQSGTNVIDWVKQPDSTKWICRNETSINTIGSELVAEYRNLRGFFKGVRLSYTALYMDKKASGFDSKYALDYLRGKINFNLEHEIWSENKIGEVTAVWNGTWQDRAGTYTEFSTSTIIDYQPYFLTDVRLTWQKKQLRANVDMNNLFDIQYADFGGLTQPGRSIRASLNYTF
jgi:vitamin B12 transporter